MHEHITEALRLWSKLIQVTPNKKSFKIGEWDLISSYDKLNEAQDLDPTGISTAMLLACLFRDYATRHVTLNEILNPDESYLQQLADARNLKKMLSSPEVSQVVDEFKSTVLAGLSSYGATAETKKKAEDPMFLGLLRLSALKAVNELAEHQFLYGKPTVASGKFNRDVYQFFNVNSLLEASVGHPEPGITLALIRTDAAVHSYFVFSVWTGAGLTVLTDKRETRHPLQEAMSRRPDRDLAARWDRYYFPYDLLDAKFTGKYVTIPNQTGLIRYKYSATPLTNVMALDPACVVWLLFMFDCLNDKYFKKAHRAALCSYLGESVAPNVPTASSLILRDGWTPLQLPTVTHDDVTTETAAWNFRRPSTKFNQWIEEKFKDQVPESLLNLAITDRQKLLPPAELAPKTAGMKLFDAVKDKLQALPPTGFGTAEQLKADHQWASRYNLAIAVNHLAHEDFKKRKDQILKWYHERAQANRENLISAAAIGLFLSDRLHWYGFCEGPHTMTREEREDDQPSTTFYLNLLQVHCNTKGRRESDWRKYLWLDGPWTIKSKCVITGNVGSLQVTVRPTCPQEIAAVCDCELSDLPIELQNYFQSEPYDGNCILDRLDPMDWRVENPWRDLELGIGICFSHRGINRRRKDLGRLPIGNWDKSHAMDIDAIQEMESSTTINCTTGRVTVHKRPRRKPRPTEDS